MISPYTVEGLTVKSVRDVLRFDEFVMADGRTVALRLLVVDQFAGHDHGTVRR